MRAFVLHPDILSDKNRPEPTAALEEAVSLAMALPDLEVALSQVVRLPAAKPGRLFGTGKLAELKDQIKDHDVGLVLINGAVTPVQQRNLEKDWGVKLLDRTGLILEIFAARAATREGVLQVDLAALSYQRTRLVRAWTHLERQRGGLGFVGGPGETQIEADRRAIDAQMVRLKRQLEKVVKTRSLHRAARAKVPYPVVALVGYTNAGKSTLFNRATGADVLAQDMLFATLDPTMRAIHLADGSEVILSDTVGFISDLPTQLVAAFRATLEEVLDADLILHMRDVSHPQTEEQAAEVHLILEQLGVSKDVPQIEVWNKIDRLSPEAQDSLRVLAARRTDVVAMSALTGEGVDHLHRMIAAQLAPQKITETLHLPHSAGRARAWLFEQGVVREERVDDQGQHFTVEWTATQSARFSKL
ncbi:GTPase HflX [Rhodobacterales bacterium LSUCC1028]|nr:GTPase HflX [Rhodobacterales bacterium LSUCC1028]